MTKITNSIWFLAILPLVLGCKESVKSPNGDILTSQSQQTTMETRGKKNSLKENVTADVYTHAAIETCNCMQPMLVRAKSLKEFQTNNQITDMKRVANEMALLQPQIQKCSDEIRRKYGQINSNADEKRILNALLTQCPDMAMLFSNLGKVAHE